MPHLHSCLAGSRYIWLCQHVRAQHAQPLPLCPHLPLQERFPGRAVQPWDARILPVLELLLDAGYRPAGAYENVEVLVAGMAAGRLGPLCLLGGWSRPTPPSFTLAFLVTPGGGGEVELRQHFDPLADDPGLVQADINRWEAERCRVSKGQ